MIVLGIHYGHNATVSVVRDGELVFCQSEERFNRIKNSTGFPSLTLEYVYSNVCSPDEVVSVVLFQESIYGYLHLKQHDFKPYQYGNYLSPEDDYTGFFERSELRWKLSQWRSKALRENSDSLRHESMKYWEYSTRQPRDKIHFINHHMGHAYSTYPNVAGWGNVLFFTLDGQGDYLSSTVSQLSGDCFKKIQSTSQRNSIGMFYSAITSIMGMKSGEHEFKVMGLAPYSQRKSCKQSW